MPNPSSTTLAINSIAQCLATASAAARQLDSAAATDLRSLLHIAGCEAERVRKVARKASTPKKPASKSAKSPAKRERAPMARTAPQQARGRRKSAANGVAAY